jgi:hypothetical protein
MSTDLTDSRVAKLSSLCKHYIAVLSKKREEAEEISRALISSRQRTPNNDASREDEFNIAAARLWGLQMSLRKLRPALQQLVRTVSQTVEHATRDDVDGLELTVLLADLEANLEQAEMLVNRLLPFASR